MIIVKYRHRHKQINPGTPGSRYATHPPISPRHSDRGIEYLTQVWCLILNLAPIGHRTQPPMVYTRQGQRVNGSGLLKNIIVRGEGWELRGLREQDLTPIFVAGSNIWLKLHAWFWNSLAQGIGFFAFRERRMEGSAPLTPPSHSDIPFKLTFNLISSSMI